MSKKPWKEIRAFVLRRDGGRCVDCGESITSRDAHVHHLVPRMCGGSDLPENLVTLCAGCHAGKHPNLQASLGRRFLERWSFRLARWLDRDLVDSDDGEKLGAVMRLFGVKRLRPGQLEAILAALRGESILFVSPTGSGKSFCFQAPAVMSGEMALVVAPLKALMTDQVASLSRRQIPASFINGDLSPDEKRLRYDLLRRGKLMFIYCAPERFDRTIVRSAEVDEMESLQPSYFVVDEAHCIDKWGDLFRPSYLKLGTVRHSLGAPPVLAFTATAGKRSRRRILEALQVPDARVILQDVDRPNISLLRLDECDDGNRSRMIRDLVEKMRQACRGKALIFVPTIKAGERVTSELRRLDVNAEFFHGKLQPKVRAVLQGRFSGSVEPPLDVMVCTSAFGMGIDIPDIRLVFHWQHPASVEDYLQEFGRAGRDGKPALAVLFSGKKDDGLLEFMLEKSLEKSGRSSTDLRTVNVKQSKSNDIKEMSDLATTRDGCFRKGILEALGTIERRRHSLGFRILSWVFGKQELVQRRGDCCDVCARRLTMTERVRWGLRIVESFHDKPVH